MPRRYSRRLHHVLIGWKPFRSFKASLGLVVILGSCPDIFKLLTVSPKVTLAQLSSEEQLISQDSSLRILFPASFLFRLLAIQYYQRSINIWGENFDIFSKFVRLVNKSL